MTSYDAVIVGCGPAGATVADNLAKKGYTIAVLEEHKKIGLPLSCAGLVSSRIFNYTTLLPASIIQNSISGAIIHSPSGETFTIGGDTSHALVINRPVFDEYLAASAEKNGASLILENKVTNIEKKNGQLTITTRYKKKRRTFTTKLLIGADGPQSLVRTMFSFPQPKETLNAVGAEITNTSLDPTFVHIFIGQHIAPGFFAWIIPINKDGTKARIGLCTTRTTTQPLTYYFNQLLKQQELKDIDIEHRIGGIIPLGPLTKTTTDNVMLVGDAAGHVKPTSGGGIYPALLCATQCATVAAEALETQDFTDAFLKKYHTTWTRDIGKELAIGMRFRNIYKKLNDQQLNNICQKLSSQKSIEIINQFGDIDYPSKLALPLLKKIPTFLKYIPHALITKKKE
ncbi:MAG: NAD(P)/FAD-dependent oxidoreductase [Candidatus Thermoplasmatota archaeon]